MVRLPSSQDITRQQPSAQRGVVSISPSPVGQQIGRAGQVVSGIAENMQANKIKEQLAYAESDFLTKQIDIENQLADDPDFDTYEARYNEAMKQAVQSSTEIVSDPQVRALLQSKIAPNIARGRGRIMSLARDKKANYTVAQTNAVMDNNIRNIRSTSNPALQSQAMNQALARIDADLENGYITPIQAQAKKEKFLQDSSTAKFESSSPEEQMNAIKYLSGSKSQGGFDVAHDIVMQNEGGYTPVDGASGAPALYGVNRKWHPEVFDEIKALYDSGNEAEAQLVAKQFYRDEFWNRYKIDELEPAQQIVVMDGVVNHHIGFSRKLVEAAKEGASSQELIAMRKREYDRLGQSPDYEASHDGWMNRLQRVSKATGDAYGYIKYVPQSKVEQVKRENEAVIKKQLSEQITDIERAQGLGVVVPNETIDRVINRAYEYNLTDIGDALSKYKSIQNDVSIFAKKSFSDQIDEFKMLRDSVKGDISKSALAESYQRVIETKSKMLKSNPWEYYSSHNIIDEPSPINFAESDSQSIASIFEDRRVAKQKIFDLEGNNVHLPLMMDEEVDQLKAYYEKAPADQAANVLTSISSSLDVNERRSLAQQIAFKDPKIATVLSVDPDTAAQIIAGDKTKGAVSGSELRKSFNESMAGFIDDPELLESAYDAVYSHYKYQELQQGITNESVDSDLLENSIKLIYGENDTISINGNTSNVFLYDDVSGDQLEDILSGVNDDVLKSINNGQLPRTSDGDFISSEDLLNEASFKTYGDGIYVAYYPGLGEIKGANNLPLQFDARKIDEILGNKKKNRGRFLQQIPMISPG